MSFHRRSNIDRYIGKYTFEHGELYQIERYAFPDGLTMELSMKRLGWNPILSSIFPKRVYDDDIEALNFVPDHFLVLLKERRTM